MPPIEAPARAVQALVERWLPGQTVVIERMGAGVSTPVYRVTVANEVSYLRLGEEPGERRDAEVRVHELVRHLGVSVPKILRWEREPLEIDRSAALTSGMPGIPLAEFSGDASEALHQAGRDLARINAIPVVGYGWVDVVAGKDRHLVAKHPTRAAWATEYLAAVDTVIAANVLSDTRAGIISATLRRTVREWADLPEQGTSRLAHGDFDHSHIYVDPVTGAYQGLIDFGEIRGTDPLYDLGQALVNAGDEREWLAFSEIVAGYATISPVDPACDSAPGDRDRHPRPRDPARPSSERLPRIPQERLAELLGPEIDNMYHTGVYTGQEVIRVPMNSPERKVAKLFQNGGSQAVRLPAEFRFEGDEVYVRREEESGDVVLSIRPERTEWQRVFEEMDSWVVSPEDWEAFDAALREAREGAVPKDDQRILDILPEDE